AIGAAHNLGAAFLDNHLHHGNALGIDPFGVLWPRVVDISDRAVRRVIVGLGGKENGVPRETEFVITVASEVMAVLALAHDLHDLRARLGRMVLATRKDGSAVTAEDLRVAGAMTALLTDAIKPNLLQTLEGGPAFVHCGPFANIAHGNNSIIADKPLDPALAEENVDAVRAGAANLAKQIENVRLFGVPAVVAINSFPTDTPAEVEAVREVALAAGARDAVVATHFVDGGDGAADLARAVWDAAASGEADFRLLYPDDAPLGEKILTIATQVYGADGIELAPAARKALKLYEDLGFGKLPVCM